MRSQIFLRLLQLLIAAALVMVGPSALFAQGATMGDSAGQTISGSTSALGELATTGGLTLAPRSQPPAPLTRHDYQRVYDRATQLLTVGTNFRTKTLQLRPSCNTPQECRQNYQDANGGELFFAFCSDYGQLDARGYCPGDDPSAWPVNESQVRGQLVRARELFGFLALAQPADTLVTVAGQPLPVRELGKAGVLSATREIANIHLIFGNEFMVDALDYRFSGSDPRADQIIAEELNQLQGALDQFNLAVDTLSHAFNADFGGAGGVHIGDFFGVREFELFAIVSDRMVTAIGEMADRYRQQGREQQALDLYARAFANQYVQALALAQAAAQQDADFAENGGWSILNNLERLRARAQAIYDGVNPFGFVDAYVPLQTYAELRALTQGDFLRDATEDEARAEMAAREFDQNRTALNQELQNLRLAYDAQLLELCGASTDNYATCTQGLMEQNRQALDAAYNRIKLIERRLLNIPEQIAIEQERAGQVIQLTLANGQEMAALEYTKGVISSYRVTEATIEAESSEFNWGAETRATTTASFCLLSCGDGGFFGGVGASVSAAVFAGYSYSDSHTHSVQTVWDPAALELGEISSVQQLQQAATEAQITGANSAAVIKNLLLQQSELMIELEITIAEFNRVTSEHNSLVDRYHNLLNLRELAQTNVIDSYLSNPAYRILRDSLTVEAARSNAIAAQFAYLTAKALEYEFLTRFPRLNEIFKARTADDIDNFLNDLEAFRVALGSPGQRNRYPYQISLAKHLLGLDDASLDPAGTLTPAQRAQRRFDRFQQIVQSRVITDATSGAVVAIEIPFTTSLLDNRIFSPNIWNNRIAGVGLPTDVPNTQGVSINLITRQFGDIGTPEVQLTHGGHASYRTVTGGLVEYLPENARLAGFVTPPGFESETATATILAGVNGNGRGAATSALFNRSVAASNWTLRIDLRSPFNAGLDLAQLEDIEIDLDTTGFALASVTQAAQADAERLQAAAVR